MHPLVVLQDCVMTIKHVLAQKLVLVRVDIMEQIVIIMTVMELRRIIFLYVMEKVFAFLQTRVFAPMQTMMALIVILQLVILFHQRVVVFVLDMEVVLIIILVLVVIQIHGQDLIVEHLYVQL